MREVWKPVTCVQMFAYDGRYKYEVSNLGRVRKSGYYGQRRRYYEPHLMSPSTSNSNGYPVINFIDNGHKKTFAVHRLVAMLFIPNPKGFGFVVHLDGNKLNNCVDNLEWRENLDGLTAGSAIFQCRRPVRQYRVDGTFVAEYPSVTAAAKSVGIVGVSCISRCCMRNPRHRTCHGFIWRYTSDDEYSGEDLRPVSACLEG